MSTYHELKVWPEFFNAINRGDKTFEVRMNDRDFKQGDYLTLREWNPDTGLFTGRLLVRYVTYIMDGNDIGIKCGYVVMGLRQRDSFPITNLQ